MRNSLLTILLSTLTLGSACSQHRPASARAATGPKGATVVPAKPVQKYPQPAPVTGKPGEFAVVKSDAEWHKVLTPDQYYILREQGTERPFTGKYHDNHAAGTYYCAADHNLLFTSDTKFESGTGWPSFFAPATASSVKVASDSSLA